MMRTVVPSCGSGDETLVLLSYPKVAPSEKILSILAMILAIVTKIKWILAKNQDLSQDG